MKLLIKKYHLALIGLFFYSINVLLSCSLEKFYEPNVYKESLKHSFKNDTINIEHVFKVDFKEIIGEEAYETMYLDIPLAELKQIKNYNRTLEITARFVKHSHSKCLKGVFQKIPLTYDITQV